MKRLLVALLAAIPSTAWAVPDAAPVAAWVAEASHQGPVVLLSPDREALVAVKTHPLLEGVEVESRSAGWSVEEASVEEGECGLWITAGKKEWTTAELGACPVVDEAAVAALVASVEVEEEVRKSSGGGLFYVAPSSARSRRLLGWGVLGGVGGLALGAAGLRPIYGGIYDGNAGLIIGGAGLVLVGPSLGHFAMGDWAGGAAWAGARSVSLIPLATDNIGTGLAIYGIATVGTLVDIPFSARRQGGYGPSAQLQILPGSRTPVVLSGRF